jgi:dihydrofolate synthase/folylpolyglutamate synthase
MNYAETIEYLLSKLPMFSRIGESAFKKDLTNTYALCEELDNPHLKIKTIHIAGTNGKGSVSHMLASILQKAGYKTGLYTSPHLYDFRERIRIDGEMIKQETVVDFTQKMIPTIEKISPSFFELTVAMAFDYFANNKVDIAIIETGLGGRLDSTNVISPELSIITNIGWDHMNMLGNSLVEIAKEKAGIIKNNIPVIIGRRDAITDTIFIDKAKENSAPLFFSPDIWEVSDSKQTTELLTVGLVNKQTKESKEYIVDLPGIYQIENIQTAVLACEILRKAGWKIEDKQIAEGLRFTKSTTGLQGRWETIHAHPRVVIEVAHNEDGIKMLLNQISQENFKQLHLIIGMVKDKDASKVLSLLPASAKYYFTKAQMPRALDEKVLKEKAELYTLNGESFTDVNEALKAALQCADPEKDLIVIIGSIFLAGEINRAVLK